MAILTADSLTLGYGAGPVVEDLSIEVPDGSITALIGPNGAGKTTVFNLVSAFLTLDEGEIEFQGRHVQGLRPHDVTRAGIGRTFQTTKVLHKMSVIDNVRVAAKDHPGEQLRWAMLRTKRTRQFEADTGARARELLELVGLTNMAEEYAATLSGGQRKASMAMSRRWSESRTTTCTRKSSVPAMW